MTDEAQIRDLLASYALRLDADDVDGCLELFSETGEFEVYGRTLAQEQIRKMFVRAPNGMHMTGSALIDVRGDVATARSQVLFVDSSTHEMRPALYDDELQRVDGHWRFARRRCRFLTPAGLSDSPQEPVH